MKDKGLLAVALLKEHFYKETMVRKDMVILRSKWCFGLAKV